ncbi:hypothetical protein [Streptomonospora alba]|uniref:hypothetical protein n=1 Tax=Streptomonospora alba TaxID=183763 RepID=UPI00069C3E6F|nr:hypothetical protein [Streptomonospora alba]
MDTTASFPAPSRSDDGRARLRRLAVATVAWASAYGGLQAYWRIVGLPGKMSPVDDDLTVFSGWPAVALCAAAVLLALGLSRPGAGRVPGIPLLLGAVGISGTLVVAATPLLLDVVGALLPGLGIGFYPLGALSRLGCLGVAALLTMLALRYRRMPGLGCPGCGRTAPTAHLRAATPRWAYAAAYLAVLGWLLRVLAQVAVGMDAVPFAGGASLLLFEVGFVLAGVLLPLALVHGWGRVWPRWVLGLAGGRVPRWLVLGPAMGVSGGLLAYFGSTLVTMVYERLNGRRAFASEQGLDLPEAFFWVAIPAYVLWGLGLAVAAYSHYHRTRAACPACHA